MQDMYRGFYRSSDDKTLAGVCGGLAHKFNLSATGLRLIFLILAFCSIGVVLYLALWILLKPVPTRNVRLG